ATHPPLALAEPARRLLHPRHRLERRGQLWRRSGFHEQLVSAPEPLALLRRDVLADELVEVRRASHRSSPSSRSASRPSPARVRVLTVPSGMPRKSATSLCDSP